MTQTLAIFIDAYRELNAKKLFWTVLILNVLAIGAFAMLGVKGDAMTFLWYEPFGTLLGPMEYKLFYSMFVVGLWFSWVATILALISTAGIFPDLMASGAIDIYLSKPIGRLRLFATKYLSGLLFVTLQVTIFSTVSFIVLGWRGGVWQPGVFWSIPLVVIFFSYLFGFCVLLGVWTRSTIAALLITLLAWGGIFIVDFVDRQAGTVLYFASIQRESLDRQIAQLETRIAAATPEPEAAGEVSVQTLTQRRDRLIAERNRSLPREGLETTRNVMFYIKSVMPKTRETLNLLDRQLFSDEDLNAAIDAARNSDTIPRRRPGGPNMAIFQMALDRERPVWWIVGTSLLFEGVALVLAAWHFCTRDF